jgi:hypothetical protein
LVVRLLLSGEVVDVEKLAQLGNFLLNKVFPVG